MYNLVELRGCTLESATPFSLSLAGKYLCTRKVPVDLYLWNLCALSDGDMVYLQEGMRHSKSVCVVIACLERVVL